MRRIPPIFFWLVFLTFVMVLMASGVWFLHGRTHPVKLTLTTPILVGPHTSLTVHFSEVVRPEAFAGKVVLSPAVPVHIAWKNWNHDLVITPLTHWALEKEYSLFIGQGKTTYFTTSPITTFTVKGPSLPHISALTPTDGAADVLLGVEDPIRVTFDQSVSDFFIDFRLDPTVPVVYQNNLDKTVFEILPQADLIPGKKYTLAIFGKWRESKEEEYQPLGTTTFTILPPAPTTWNQNLSLRASEAKRFTRAKKTEGKYIDINLESQVMTLFENGQALDAYIISSGKRGLETPKGEFAIENKASRPWSKKYGLYMPYWMALVPSGLFGIHELPEWPGGYKEGANHLGTPVSHGCVRLGIGPAVRVYTWADIGTPVMIY